MHVCDRAAVLTKVRCRARSPLRAQCRQCSDSRDGPKETLGVNYSSCYQNSWRAPAVSVRCTASGRTPERARGAIHRPLNVLKDETRVVDCMPLDASGCPWVRASSSPLQAKFLKATLCIRAEIFKQTVRQACKDRLAFFCDDWIRSEQYHRYDTAI